MRLFHLHTTLSALALHGSVVHAGRNVDGAGGGIDRRGVVRQFNPARNASSDTTPMQVGNGNFAFGVDVTGLQTFKPYGALSTWAWHNFSLPTTEGQTSVDGRCLCLLEFLFFRPRVAVAPVEVKDHAN